MNSRHLNPLVFVLIAIGSVTTFAATTNEWQKTSSGNWEEPFWSLGRLPADTDVVLFDSPGFKALAIQSSTTSGFASSLTNTSLIIQAPTNSFNQLLLNFAGLNVPLFVSSNLTVGTNGSLVSHFTALGGGNLLANGPVQIIDGSRASFTNVVVGPNPESELDLTNSDFTASAILQVNRSTVNQSGGVVLSAGALQLQDGGLYSQSGGTANFETASNLNGFGILNGTVIALSGGNFHTTSLFLNNGGFMQTGGTNRADSIGLSPNAAFLGTYTLSNGLLVSSNVQVGIDPFGMPEPSSTTFTQFGGIHTNQTMSLYGGERANFELVFGRYNLAGGLLVSSEIDVLGGSMSQADGATNDTSTLVIGSSGSYNLTGGEIVTSNVNLGGNIPSVIQTTAFNQSGGNHRIQNVLSLYGFATSAAYSFTSGSLAVSNIEVHSAGKLLLSAGTFTNSRLITMDGGFVSIGAPQLQFGQLLVTSNLPSFGLPTPSTIGFSAGTSTIRFLDSHDVPWSPPALIITNWNGADHIFVGNNSSGLTPQQLSLVTFLNPGGFAAGSYPATILSTGEIIPSTNAPTINFASSSSGTLVLSWSGSFQLFSSTNVLGPYDIVSGASSPYTNSFSDPFRFFRLRSPDE